MGKKKWTEEKILESALKEKYRSDWEKNESGAYFAAKKLRIFDQATAHMKQKGRTKYYKKYSEKEIADDALKYKSKKDWFNNSKKIYSAAYYRGLIQSVTSHMITINKPKGYWTSEKIKAETSNIKTLKEWRKKSEGSYQAAKRIGILNEIVQKMEVLGNLEKRCIYTIELHKQNLAYIGLTFNFKERIKQHMQSERFKDLIKLYGREAIKVQQLTKYLDAKKASIIETQLIDAMEKIGWKILNKKSGGGLGGNKLQWTEEKIYLTIENYSNYSDWKKNEPKAYLAAIILGKRNNINILKKISEIIPKTQVWSENRRKKLSSSLKKYWLREGYLMKVKFTKDIIMSDAQKYKTKSEWKLNSLGCYRASQRMGIFEEAIKHMISK
jgi:predicted GIY-YIG superfamily endonuclease